ncbi:hypothetical protein VTK73DRAFT_4808 [Phialemonium thermophilum]|uniref:Up-regulated during septation protein 1 domain-containing protein n=1 Tax=Phialemonium thermophilum TaxID=223376 RepID=A0ABR3XYP0_9PEZI
MNGGGMRIGNGSGLPIASVAQNVGLGGRDLVEGYRRDIITSLDKAANFHNSLSIGERPGDAGLLDMNDPIQVHLLTETALLDSKEFEILSQEEVDSLKKRIQSLTQRVEQTKANLAIQLKYRDAALSMAKLYSPSGGRTLSITSSRDSVREAEMERVASERRCEELATELFSLEKRLTDSQGRLLRHTAGILQLTHRASSKSSRPPNVWPFDNGIPGSPESLYAHSNGRDSMEAAADGTYLDEKGVYLQLDPIDEQATQSARNVIEIPMKSPVREQLREEADRLRQENSRLTADADLLRSEVSQHTQFAAEVERRLEDLGNRLRAFVVGFDGQKSEVFSEPSALSSALSDPLKVKAVVTSQLDYLERAITVAMEEHNLLVSEREKDNGATAMAHSALARLTSRIDGLNNQIYAMLRVTEPDYPLPPESSKSDSDEQIGYLQDGVNTLRTELARAAELSSSTSVNKQKSEQIEAVLSGLWDIIQSGYAEIQQRRAARRSVRDDKVMDNDEGDASDDELINTHEPYSLPAFSTRVQWLYAQATNLKEQKAVLQRQIKQQRDLNNKSSYQKDSELQQTMAELEDVRAALSNSREEVREVQAKLSKAVSDLEMLRQTSAANELAASRASQEQIKERDERIVSLQSSAEDLQSKLSTAEADIASLQSQLSDANEAQKQADVSVENLESKLKEKDEELDRLNLMVVELKTEVTIARAELDGAYGSRAERAAEAAALSQNSQANDLSNQVDKLKAELANVLKELEDITKETISAEKEKLELESKLDDALAAKTQLESDVKSLKDKLEHEVSRLQEQLDAEKLKVPASPGGAGPQARAGASMLSEQFRATMKEERKKFQEELREEQARRRRLEDELRALRRAQGPGKSPLGPLSPK